MSENCSGPTALRADPGGRINALAGVYRSADSEPWQDVEIVGYQRGGLVLREVGKVYPGVLIAPLDRVRIAGRVFEFREPFGFQRMVA
jgi:hypothetical protein